MVGRPFHPHVGAGQVGVLVPQLLVLVLVLVLVLFLFLVLVRVLVLAPLHLVLVRAPSCGHLPHGLASQRSTSASAAHLGRPHVLHSRCRRRWIQHRPLLVPFSLIRLTGFLHDQERTPQQPADFLMSTGRLLI